MIDPVRDYAAEEAMEGIEVMRDAGISSDATEDLRQAYAEAMFEHSEINEYARPDFDFRAAALQAALGIGAPPAEVLGYAQKFYEFLTDKPVDPAA